MQESYLESEIGELDDVAKPKERLESIETRLDDIEGSIGISSKTPKQGTFWPKTLTDWCAVITLILVILSACFGTMWYLGRVLLDAHIRSATDPIRTDIVGIQGDVREIKATLAGIQIKQLLSGPRNAQNSTEARNIIIEAKNKGIAIPDAIIKEAGTRFLENSQGDPKAWETGLDFVSYHTVSNENLIAVGSAQQIAKTQTNVNLTTYYGVKKAEGYPYPQATVGGEVPLDRAAIMHPLGVDMLQGGQTHGNELILLEGGGLQLDNMFMRNVVIRNAAVSYSGGPVTLQDVIFVNCTFILPNEPTPKHFAEEVLNQSAVTFPLA